MSSKVQSLTYSGNNGMLVDIECHLSNNLPNIVIVGFANKAVDEARERIRGAFSSSRIMLPRKRITLNLAPADIPKADSGFDLALAVAILLANNQVVVTIDKQQAFIGELGLDGSTRAIRGIIGKILTGRAKGITTFFIPSANLAQAQLVPTVTLIPIDNLRQLYDYLSLEIPLTSVATGNGLYQNLAVGLAPANVQLSEVVGQDQAKRALEIAAAGGHNLLFNGPPGTGKSMLAKALPSVLPPLNREEILEVTHLHSLAGHDYEQIITDRPFRAPHHTASHAAITGGGANLQPGEISLAHRGVLFFDELPEFRSETLESLRQPLEDRSICLARVNSRTTYPANFILVATANPCPCGYYGQGDRCKCQRYSIDRYRERLSGPILDRIDLCTEVNQIEHQRLLRQTANSTADQAVRQRIMTARALQAKRFQTPNKLNADMTNSDVRRLAKLKPEAIALLNQAAQNVYLSARAYMRCIKVARTIADLEKSSAITASHISEAINYRYIKPPSN